MPPDHDEKRSDESKDIGPGEVPDSRMNPTVFAAEILEILGSRQRRGLARESKALEDRGAEISGPEGPGRIWNPSIDLGLVGLALSGGGIRSSTFCLGVLQALNKAGLIKRIDYLSTVSGGGYIGAFWTCLLQRSRIEKTEDSQEGEYLASAPEFEEIGPLYELSHRIGNEEGPVFQRLRNYANYLKPHGILDAIRFPALILRGLFINFLMGLPYLLLAAFLTVLFFEEPIRSDALGFSTLGVPASDNGLPLTAFLFMIWLGVIVVSTAYQSLMRRLGNSNPKFRRKLLSTNHGMLLVVIVAGLLEYQPLAINYIHDLNKDLSGPLFSALGALTAFFSALGATRTSDLAAKLGLALACAAIPLMLILIHFTLVSWAVFGAPSWLAELGAQPPNLVWSYLGLGILLALVSILLFDVNATSLHNYYRDSLSKTFLFSVQRQTGDGDDRGQCEGKTDIQGEDDVTLTKIDIKESGGPYHLINTVVNNPDLGETNLRGRRAELFVFGSKFSGNNRLGYCRTEDLEKVDESANLGTVLAISAAAVSPNMGQKTSNPLIVFMLAMLNVRLGYWLPAPRMVNSLPGHWKLSRRSHFVGPLYFFMEMFGLPRFLRGRYINLSDAGHLENLGILELLRRRCERVIAIDAEADPSMKFNGLATVIRLARTDLGINIDIDLDELRTDEQGLSRRHWVLGTINYGAGKTGTLLYIKASLTGSENEYITEFRVRNPSFPHESTVDQFFDEVRFEAYRSLGHKVGASMFYRSSSEFSKSGSYEKSFEWFRNLGSTEEMFHEFSKRDTSTVLRRESFFKLSDRRLAIEKILSEPSMRGYATELVEMPTALPIPATPETTGDGHFEREFQFHQLVNQQLQLMEAALFGLSLHDPKNRRRKSNLGWMNLFHRWSRSKTFKRYWAISIGNYGTALMLFCKEEFELDLVAAWTEWDESRPLSVPEQKLWDDARKVHALETTELRLFIACLATSGDADAAANGFRVATAVVDRDSENPALVHFGMSNTFQSIGLARTLLKDLKNTKSIWNQGNAGCREPLLDPYFRVLMRLGYQDLTPRRD